MRRSRCPPWRRPGRRPPRSLLARADETKASSWFPPIEKFELCGPAYATPRPSAGRLAGRRQLLGQLVQLELLQVLAHRVELGGAVVDQVAALAAELERLAQTRLAGVEPVDDLLEPLDSHLIGLRCRALVVL